MKDKGKELKIVQKYFKNKIVEQKARIDKLKAEVEEERAFSRYFVLQSIERGKTIDIMLPLLSSGQITNLFVELYDLRQEKKEVEA